MHFSPAYLHKEQQ